MLRRSQARLYKDEFTDYSLARMQEVDVENLWPKGIETAGKCKHFKVHSSPALSSSLLLYSSMKRLPFSAILMRPFCPCVAFR